MDEAIEKTILNQITGFTKEAVEQINSGIQPPGDVLIFVGARISLHGKLPNKYHKLQAEVTTKLHQNAG